VSHSLYELSLALQALAGVPIAALVVSIISIIFAAIALYLTYKRDQREIERDRKKVDIVSSIQHRPLLSTDTGYVGSDYFRCTVTNNGVPSVKIRRVGLRSHGNAGVEIPLELEPDEQERVLVQGDSQVWEKDLDELRAMLSGPKLRQSCRCRHRHSSRPVRSGPK
jgi:archaellum component FlaF (FlaF/FlaG flagellin family)